MKIGLRPYDQKIDEPFIYATWSRNCYYSLGLEKKGLKKKAWFAEKFKEIGKDLKEATVLVACLLEDPYVIVGYIVIKDGKLIWTYTKQDFRNQGIEELLLKQLKENQDGISRQPAPSPS